MAENVRVRVRVEPKCDGCGAETLATDGWRSPKCRDRAIIKRHGHVLSSTEITEAGFAGIPAGIPKG